MAADHQFAAQGIARAQLGQLFGQQHRANRHAVAQQAGYAIPQDAAGYEAEAVSVVADLDRVPGVGATLVAQHNVVAGAEQVRQLALALIAPLGAHNHGNGHRSNPRMKSEPSNGV